MQWTLSIIWAAIAHHPNSRPFFSLQLKWFIHITSNLVTLVQTNKAHFCPLFKFCYLFPFMHPETIQLTPGHSLCLRSRYCQLLLPKSKNALEPTPLSWDILLVEGPFSHHSRKRSVSQIRGFKPFYNLFQGDPSHWINPNLAADLWKWIGLLLAMITLHQRFRYLRSGLPKLASITSNVHTYKLTDSHSCNDEINILQTDRLCYGCRLKSHLFILNDKAHTAKTIGRFIRPKICAWHFCRCTDLEPPGLTNSYQPEDHGLNSSLHPTRSPTPKLANHRFRRSCINKVSHKFPSILTSHFFALVSFFHVLLLIFLPSTSGYLCTSIMKNAVCPNSSLPPSPSVASHSTTTIIDLIPRAYPLIPIMIDSPRAVPLSLQPHPTPTRRQHSSLFCAN